MQHFATATPCHMHPTQLLHFVQVLVSRTMIDVVLFYQHYSLTSGVVHVMRVTFRYFRMTVARLTEIVAWILNCKNFTFPYQDIPTVRQLISYMWIFVNMNVCSKHMHLWFVSNSSNSAWQLESSGEVAAHTERTPSDTFFATESIMRHRRRCFRFSPSCTRRPNLCFIFNRDIALSVLLLTPKSWLRSNVVS